MHITLSTGFDLAAFVGGVGLAATVVVAILWNLDRIGSRVVYLPMLVLGVLIALDSGVRLFEAHVSERFHEVIGVAVFAGALAFIALRLKRSKPHNLRYTGAAC